MDAALTLTNLSHSYGAKPTLSDISLTLQHGELLALLGPSGCGKTTLLRLVAGLEKPLSGTIHHGAALWSDAAGIVAAEKRRVGFVFQDYALFPHLTALENVLFGMTPRDRNAATGWLARMGIAAQADTYPHLLSGGQQQRVALARALAMQPRLLLLDEPFSGLDAQLRQQVRLETRQLLKAEGVAAILVTHDADEAMTMADSVALLRSGHIEQYGVPAGLYCHPVSPFAARFFGTINEYICPLKDGFAITPFGLFPCALQTGDSVLAMIRPHSFSLAAPSCAADGVLTITDSSFAGHHRLYSGVLADSGAAALVALDPEPEFPSGSTLRLSVNRREMFFF